MLDSCHSGSAGRNANANPRVVRRSEPRDTNHDVYAKNAMLTASAAVVNRARIVFSATKPEEEALDAPMDGRSNGLFTRAFVQALAALPRDASPRRVLQATAQEMRRLIAVVNRHSTARHRPTTPTLEAPSQQALDAPLVDGGPRGARLAWVPVELTAAGVTLRGGADLGAVGSHWALYGPDDVTFAPGRALATGTVTEVSGHRAILSLDAGAPDPATLAGYRAVMVAPPAPARTVAVHLDGDRALCDSLRTNLRQHVPGLRFARRAEPADFLVQAKPGYVKLVGPAGDVVVERATAAKIGLVLTRSSIAETLLSLDNRAAGLHVEARVATRPAAAAVGTRHGFRIEDTGASTARFRVRRKGDPIADHNSLQIAVKAAADCYVTVVYVDSQGGVGLLFPAWTFHPDEEKWQLLGQSYLPDGRLTKDEETLLPDANSKPNQAGFAWSYRYAGVQTVRVFATRTLANAERIRTAVKELHASQAMQRATPATARDALLKLRAALLQVATRGFPVARQKHAPQEQSAATARPRPATAARTATGWAAATLSIEVDR